MMLCQHKSWLIKPSLFLFKYKSGAREWEVFTPGYLDLYLYLFITLHQVISRGTKILLGLSFTCSVSNSDINHYLWLFINYVFSLLRFVNVVQY